ncbi:flagellar biosynthetic protein FliQ [Helicobacter pylori]|uniref:flagellar biosynthesis protein FliQ n=1 Tax=Helicobacter pylori TaxID=210 RepID=UPI000D398AFC|nr:flagellar biosynthesis protein FliQ [Helicobacter pylori]MCK0505001.1 flagellar biosynthesis protein FliQ [Helicobacter pylori]PUD40017.1 flagellar biosynthetic protein FliQ [Helicobacter pylori]WRG31159.1 flagellar biosynthesis protein FliQ [Helicobacter pylori]WRG54103.1 flagellar biosynthesis protein FliQ [Helicobacter pylori]
MESQLMKLAIETYKITLMISLPVLLTGLVVGLLVSIFQATTQINEMTLSFVPKILAVIGVLILTMPWMTNMLLDYTKTLIKLIPKIIG